MSSYKYINVYCAEKCDQRGGYGGRLKRVDYDGTEEDLKQKTTEARELQKIINAKYRETHPARKAQKPPAYIKKDDPIRPPKKFSGEEPVPPLTSGLPEIDWDGQDTDFSPSNASSILLLGSSKAGKTYLMKALYKKFYTPSQKVFIHKGKPVKFISTLFSINQHAAVYDDFDCFKCNRFDKNCESLIKQCKKINMVSSPPNKYNFLFMLDDIVDSKYSATLNQLILTLRNSAINSILSLQYPYLLQKSARGSIHHTFFGKCNTDEQIEAIIKSFLSSKFTSMGYTTMPAKINLYKKLTEDYAFLYYYPRKDILKRFKLALLIS